MALGSEDDGTRSQVSHEHRQLLVPLWRMDAEATSAGSTCRTVLDDHAGANPVVRSFPTGSRNPSHLGATYGKNQQRMIRHGRSSRLSSDECCRSVVAGPDGALFDIAVDIAEAHPSAMSIEAGAGQDAYLAPVAVNERSRGRDMGR